MDGKEREKKFTSYWIIYLALAIVIALCSFFICVFNFQQVNDTFGLFVPLMHIYLGVGALVLSIILKIIFKDKISFLILFLLVIVVVFSSQAFFSNSLESDGFMYPLVEYGGPLYFLRIGDYNFDGISDIGHHPLEEYFTKTFTYTSPQSSDASVYMESIDFNVTAQSKSNTLGRLYADEKKNLIILDLDEDIYLLISVDITVNFYDLLANSNCTNIIKFYTSNEKGDKLNYISSRKVSNTCIELNLRESFVESAKEKLYLYYETESAD